MGNLEVKHSNPRNIYMSTLDDADVDVMRATKTCVGAQRFQYDYLNDDITDEGNIDYSKTEKVPASLRQAIADGKKILVLINPPYGEASSSDNAQSIKNESKAGIATNQMSKSISNYGYAKRELFVQFIARITIEIPNAAIAMFSTLKYINASNFENFRKVWIAEYIGGFVVHCKAFDGLTGDFPIGFLVWQTNINSKRRIFRTEIVTDVINKNAEAIGEKLYYNVSTDKFLSEWLPRLKTNTEKIPLKNAIHPQNSKAKVVAWVEGSIGYFWSAGNDLQQSGQHTALFSSVFSNGCGYYVNAENLWQVSIIFSIRQLVQHTWVNHNDQFLQPDKFLTEEFKTDCLIWMLFNGKNLTASANDLEWNGRNWSIVNHFIPFTEAEVNAPERFESDFMVQYLADKTLSPEAQAVMEAGKKLWQAYFAHTDVRSVRDELKLNRPDVGWYQIRKALQARNASGDFQPISFKPFEETYKALSEKLQPMVYDLGFLRI